MRKDVVILGAGQAGFQAAASLRDNGFDGCITLVGDEPHLPYERPPLSKSYLTGGKERKRLQLRPEEFYAAHDIELLLGEHATEIDRFGRKVALRSGRRLSYDHLVLATGAGNRRLPADADLDGILYLRTLSEADMLVERLVPARDVVIIGAGFIGLELAAVLRKLGKTTHVLDLLPRVMSRAVSSVTSRFFLNEHANWGTTIVTGVTVSKVLGRNGKVNGVLTDDGRNFAADLVVVGVGVVPNVELAAAAGLSVHGGIIVDSRLRTSDPAISAIGDCALFPSRFARTRIRLESVQNAVDQARCVAGCLVGRNAEYTSVPWFWSDQADIRLQMVGITADCDRAILRGDPGMRKFSVFCFRGARFLGIESINTPSDHMFGRRLLASGGIVTPEQAADLSFDFKPHLAALTQVQQKELHDPPRLTGNQ
jgi:3-phenylpropionate/trans-cinnamate dioxygenase ferredoxin reductase component